MPCKCGKSVESGNKCGCRVRYCYCGACNHCHVNGICPSGKFNYSQKIDGKPDSRKPFVPGQSHGGHGWVPLCDKCNTTKPVTSASGGGGGAVVKPVVPKPGVPKTVAPAAIVKGCSKKCGRTVESGNKCGCRVRYCYCGACNHCHVGGICPDGKFNYSQKIEGKPDSRKPFIPGQSHGGHRWVPHCDKCIA